MEREHRRVEFCGRSASGRAFLYLVVKYKDMLKFLNEAEQIAFIELAKKIDAGREAAGEKPVECVCVEHDLP